jgi:hypothetical protein
MQHQHVTPRGPAFPHGSGQTQPIPARIPVAPTQAQPAVAQVPPEDQPLRELVSRLSQDGSLLIRQEIALAKLELGEKAARLRTQATLMAAGGIALYTGLLALVAGLILLLALALPAWASALLVGTAIATVGAVLLLRGKNNLERLDLKPERTVANVGQDVEAIREAVRGT